MVHEEITPNPMNVAFISQSFICKYQEAFDKEQPSSPKNIESSVTILVPTGNDNLPSKQQVPGKGNPTEDDMTMKQKNLLGNINFNGGASSVAPTYPAIVQEAVVEASIKARDLGF